MGASAPSATACPSCGGPTELNEAGDWIYCRPCVAAWSLSFLAVQPFDRPTVTADTAVRLRRFAEDLRSCGDDLTPADADDVIRRPEWWPADVAFIPLQAHAASLVAILDDVRE